MGCKTARNDTVPGVTSYSALVGLLQNFFAILQAQIIDIQYLETNFKESFSNEKNGRNRGGDFPVNAWEHQGLGNSSHHTSYLLRIRLNREKTRNIQG